MALPSRDKRRFPRVKAKGIAAYLKLDAKTAGCVIEDISAGGLFIRTDRVVAVGSNISLDLVDPEVQKAVSVSGTVVGIILKEAAQKRGVPQGLRIKFNRQAGATHEYLQKLMARLGAPMENAPVFYAVTKAPPKPRTQELAAALPPVKRGPPLAAGRRPSSQRRKVPPTLYPIADGSPESTRAAPDELSGGLLDQLPLGEDDAGPTDAESAALRDQSTNVRARNPFGESEQTMLHDPGTDEGSHSDERIAELEAELAARDERISELEAEVKQLRLQLAGDDATPIPARPPRR